MPVKLSTTIKSIAAVPNSTNATLLYEFYEYMKANGTSESCQNGKLKILIYFARFLGIDAEFVCHVINTHRNANVLYK
jgi:hypothetical protein